jgi:hypothetical protein
MYPTPTGRSGRGVVDEIEEVDKFVVAGGIDLDLDEDAFTGTQFGCMDHIAEMSFGHPRQAARPAGIVEHLAALGDVRNAVLELHEHVGTVVDAQPVTGAQVLVDPDTHGA